MRLRRIEPVLRRALRGECAAVRGDHWLIAISGGADSVALLAGLCSLRRESGLLLTAAHVHHGLRGADADADLAHVRAICLRFGVRLLSRTIDSRERMRRLGLSGEAGLRVLRRTLLRRAMRVAGAQAIATAHTADDQLETLLLRLARGTTPSGLAGMRAQHGFWRKPLLDATRYDIESDLTSAGIGWREDASNRDLTLARNRIRHRVVPALLDLADANRWAPARASLARRAAATARELARDDAVLRRQADAALEQAACGEATFEVGPIARLAPAVRARLLAAAWRKVAPSSSGLPRRHRDALERILAGPARSARVTLPGGALAVRTADRVHFVVPPALRDRPARRRERTAETALGGGFNARLRSGSPARPSTAMRPSTGVPCRPPGLAGRSRPTR